MCRVLSLWQNIGYIEVYLYFVVYVYASVQTEVLSEIVQPKCFNWSNVKLSAKSRSGLLNTTKLETSSLEFRYGERNTANENSGQGEAGKF